MSNKFTTLIREFDKADKESEKLYKYLMRESALKTPPTGAEALTQELTQPNLTPSAESITIDNPTRDPQAYKASADQLAQPFSFYQHNLAKIQPQPVQWLWQKRLPLTGLTLLDGDHACGKSLLTLQIAAHISSGTPMPDGTPTTQGGVIIVTPNTDPTTQIQLLTALGADLTRIEMLSNISEQASDPHTSSHHPFSLPDDLAHLIDAINRVDARLIILDPFITLLSRHNRWTNERLGHLLTDLNQILIERNIACLLIRNCPTKGGHARPSVLEKSDHFPTIAASHLLLAPHPMQPDQLLLSHAQNRHAALTTTLILKIQTIPDKPDIPHITILGTHTLQAKDFIENRSDTLHRRLLFQHLQTIISQATDPLPVTTLYTLSPHSSPFQIQRALNDLLKMGQIQRPARGFYSLAPANPVFPSKLTATTKLDPTGTTRPKATAAITSNSPSADTLNPSAAITSNSPSADTLNPSAAITSSPQPADTLNPSAAITSNSPSADTLNQSDHTEAYKENANAHNNSAPSLCLI